MAPPGSYDAVIVVSFGGPEGPDEVVPFLENVLRGRNVPHERLLEVAEHYQLFGGVSPINAQNQALIAALETELAAHGPAWPVYWGNRNWSPFLADTVGQMAHDGVRRALAFVTSGYASYSGCHQYLDDIALARAAVGPSAPVIDKLRVFHNHPGFVEPMAEQLRAARTSAGSEAPVLFSAHSIPVAQAQTCDYVAQLQETAGLVAERAGHPDWKLVFQSRSGPASQPWLEPDVVDCIEAMPPGTPAVIVAPIGFVSDHMEVMYDLHTEAAAAAEKRGIRLVVSGTAGDHPKFVTMIRQLIAERVDPGAAKLALGRSGPYHDVCVASCCPAPPPRPGRPPQTPTSA